jgi:16S rRNA (guanine527-N7)-methyltransferase
MREAIDAQARLLLAWGQAVNLSAIREPAAIALEHVADSLAAVPPLLDRLAARGLPRRPIRLLDLGSGAGYPGLPVAVAIPVAQVTLVDSVTRKVAFLEVAAAAARRAFEAHGEEPVQIRVSTARAEELGRRPDDRDRWDIVTARAVAPLPWLLELALPLVRPGGIFVAWKRDAGDGGFAAELAHALPSLADLGADPRPENEPVALDGLRDHRLLFVTKRRPTPERWPRRVRGRRRLLP